MLASEIYDILQSSSVSDMDNVNEMNSRRRKAQFFLGSTNKRAKTVVLHIDGLDDSVRNSPVFLIICSHWRGMTILHVFIHLPQADY